MSTDAADFPFGRTEALSASATLAEKRREKNARIRLRTTKREPMERAVFSQPRGQAPRRREADVANPPLERTDSRM